MLDRKPGELAQIYGVARLAAVYQFAQPAFPLTEDGAGGHGLAAGALPVYLQDWCRQGVARWLRGCRVEKHIVNGLPITAAVDSAGSAGAGGHDDTGDAVAVVPVDIAAVVAVLFLVLWPGTHIQADRALGSKLAVTHRIGKAVRARVALLGLVGVGAVGVSRQRALAGVCHGDGQAVALHIAGQRAQVDLEAAVLLHAITGVARHGRVVDGFDV